MVSKLFEGFIDKLEAKNMKITFSENCVSGLVPTYADRCECWRCRNDRGEDVTEESEIMAKMISKSAGKKFQESSRKILGLIK